MPTLSKPAKFNRDSWVVKDNPWYSLTHKSPYESVTPIVATQDVVLHPHKCVGCLRKFKTMKQTQEYCSYACFALGNKSPGGSSSGQPEIVTVGIIGPSRKKAWHIDKRRKSLSDIKDIQDVLTGDD